MASVLQRSIALYKEAYEGHPNEVWALVILTFVNRMGTMVLPFLSVYLTTILGFSLIEAGVLMGAFGLGSLAGSYIGGRFSDIIGANQVIILSLAISGCFFISLQWATTFYPLFILIFLAALFGEAYRPAMMSAVGDYVTKKQTGRTMAFLRLAVNLGMSAGPAIGGFVAVALGYSWLFWIDGITCIIAAAYFWHASRNWEKIHLTRKTEAEHEGKPVSVPPYKNKNYLLFLFATFLFAFGFIQWFHTVPVFIKGEWGFDERYIGILLGMSSGLIVLTEMPAVHWIEKTDKIKYAVLAGIALIGLSYLPFLLPAALIFCFTSSILWTFGEILSLPFNSSISIQLSPDHRRGEYMAWYWMTWSVANILAPLIGLGVAGEFGFSVFWMGLAAMVAVSFLMNYKLSARIM